MEHHDRRRFLKMFTASSIAIALFPSLARSFDCKSPHPFNPPDKKYGGQCPVCGMIRSMWARTWITFDPLGGVSQVCSFHCLADWIEISGRRPKNIGLIIYHEPDHSVPAAEAYIVAGSAAAGTMSPVSKIVFAEKSKAVSFSAKCGGEVVDFEKALSMARASVTKENKMINVRRLEKGKIVEPNESENCPVCNMYPIRYPYGKCQIRTRENETLHFCSTQCMFAFMDNPSKYVGRPLDPFLIWVVDRNTGMWISGFAAFYVIGSTKEFGPMGYEAFPLQFEKRGRDVCRGKRRRRCHFQ